MSGTVVEKSPKKKDGLKPVEELSKLTKPDLKNYIEGLKIEGMKLDWRKNNDDIITEFYAFLREKSERDNAPAPKTFKAKWLRNYKTGIIFAASETGMELVKKGILYVCDEKGVSLQDKIEEDFYE